MSESTTPSTSNSESTEPEEQDAIDPRGYRPENPKLSWKLLAQAFPLYTGSFFLLMLAVALVVPFTWQRATAAIGVTLLSLTVLDQWLRPRINLEAEKERRERTWSPSSETFDLVIRQSTRYLAVALPLIVISAVVATLGVSVIMRNMGLWQ